MTGSPHVPSDGAQAILSLRSASFGYADRAVISGVTLDIHAGEVVALLGPNGSGKSSLVKGMLGLNDHLGGTVTLFGIPFERFRDHGRLGYVPQRHTLSTSVRATVTEIVAIGRLPHQGWLGRPNREDRRIIAESLALVGLADRAGVDVGTLSGGQQRRVLIARALAAQPEVLILDEPTAGVDLASQEVFSQVLARLADRGATMLIVTHEIDAVHDVLTRVVELDNGRITYDGNPTDHDGREHPGRDYDGRDHPGRDHDGHHHEDTHHDERGLAPSSPAAGPLDHAHPRRGGRHA